MVASLVTERMKQIHQICRRYQVERLHLFGSAADGQMRPGRRHIRHVHSGERGGESLDGGDQAKRRVAEWKFLPKDFDASNLFVYSLVDGERRRVHFVERAGSRNTSIGKAETLLPLEPRPGHRSLLVRLRATFHRGMREDDGYLFF